jgi:hypothetical protein
MGLLPIRPAELMLFYTGADSFAQRTPFVRHQQINFQRSHKIPKQTKSIGKPTVR